MKHSFATDAIRRGVPERYLQTFLGHWNVESTRRYARLADNAMLEVLRPPQTSCRQAADKVSENETEQDQGLGGGPSRTRSWFRSEEISKENERLGIWPGWPIGPNRSFQARVTPRPTASTQGFPALTHDLAEIEHAGFVAVVAEA